MKPKLDSKNNNKKENIIIESKNYKTCTNPHNNILNINIKIDNIDKIPLLILFYSQFGFNKFQLNYKYENIKIPITKILDKIQTPILNLINAKNFEIYYKGFPKCIFETQILKPNQRFKYESNIHFNETNKYKEYTNEKLKNDENNNKEYGNKEYDNNKFIDIDLKIHKNYIENFGKEEFMPLIYNNELYEINKNKIESFKNTSIKKISKTILNDFKKEKEYKRKWLIYVDSYPQNLEESSKERFIYFIYNSKKDFEKTFKLINKFFENESINKLKKYLKKSDEFALSFSLMGDLNIRQSFYFTLNDFNEKEIHSIKKILNINIKKENLWGIGIDFKNNDMKIKTYYKYPKLDTEKIKEAFKEFKNENKSKLKLFLKNNSNQNYKGILIDYKFYKHTIFSKKVEFSFQYNELNKNEILNTINKKEDYIYNKELYSICFEIPSNQISNNTKEKINLYYALKK
ncbi:MAG: hypothetical protein KC589_02875 [Nanoarchaeota archaeon]|nr:hypothetical protein [Nanoarchaeota archaeon]